jgi:hypothetical protein
MAKEFSFEIMICSQRAKEAAYETAGYLYTLLEQAPEYKAKSSVRQNLKSLFSLMVPEPPWSGPPVSHTFGISWGTVKKLVSGAIGIAIVKVKGE